MAAILLPFFLSSQKQKVHFANHLASIAVQHRVPHDDSNEEDFHQRAAEHASRNAGGSGGADFFSGILGNFMGNKSQLANQEVDEERRSPTTIPISTKTLRETDL